jgi:transcriptional regulator with XRE-family HTH domain
VNPRGRGPAPHASIAAETRAKLHKATGGLSSRLASGIRALRARQGLTLSKAAEAAGLDLRHYQKLENGETNSTMITLARLADGFDVDALKLFSDAPFERRTPGRPRKRR